MTIRIIPYARNSMSARDIANKLTEKLGYKVWRGEPKMRATNINWGSERTLPGARWINAPELKALATNKINTFRLLEQNGVSHVPYTTSEAVARAWQVEGATVLARTPAGQGGSGIRVVRPDENLPYMPLYTKYLKKKKEFRVHVMNGSVIDVQEKRRRNGAGPGDGIIRSHDNGWVFCHQNIVEPTTLRQEAIAAMAATGLDFGAVDLIWNETRNQVYVLEINTAPGMSPSTCETYANAIIAAYA